MKPAMHMGWSVDAPLFFVVVAAAVVTALVVICAVLVTPLAVTTTAVVTGTELTTAVVAGVVAGGVTTPVAPEVELALAVKQPVVPVKIVKTADGFVRPRLSRMTSVHCVPAGRLTNQVMLSALVVPTVVSGAAPACPPGWTVIMNGGALPENVSRTGRHSVTPSGVLIAGSGACANAAVAANKAKKSDLICIVRVPKKSRYVRLV